MKLGKKKKYDKFQDQITMKNLNKFNCKDCGKEMCQDEPCECGRR